MLFSEKLSFLLGITQTSNSRLALAVRLDASYISRMRNGTRPMPQNKECILEMAEYFARNCTEGYRQRIISEATGLLMLPSDQSLRAEIIFRWLQDDNAGVDGRAGVLPGSMPTVTDQPVKAGVQTKQDDARVVDPVTIYYGIQGKRDAVFRMMTEVAARNKPQNILLFSDEEMSWMTKDPAFSQRLMALMFEVLGKGNRIRIVHAIQRNLDEMLNAISLWMPLYMTGRVEPYFYPKKRDGVFKSTLFAAPETAAVISQSIGEHTEQAVNLLFHDRSAVASYIDEYMQFFHMCRPLMCVYTMRERAAYSETLMDFDRGTTDAMVKTESVSLLTMPESLLVKITGRAGTTSNSLPDLHGERRGLFYKHLEYGRYSEIITLPEISAVRSGGVKVALSDFLEGGVVYYTPEEYGEHLEALIELLDRYPGFHLHIIRRLAEDRYSIFAREESGIVVAKTSQPPVALWMNEANMTAAFWDYLIDLIGRQSYENPDNAAAVKKLRRYLALLNGEAQG